MLEQVDLTRSLPKAAFKRRMPALQERLRVLQRCASDAGVATILVLEGWDASGKGSLVARLVEKLDPRGFKVTPTYAPLPEELYRPWLWRFWNRLPAYGTMAVFDRSWYGRVLVERVEKLASRAEVTEAFNEINDFERALVDDGQVLVKLFLHISKKEQRKRYEKCEKDPYQRWKIKPEDWRHHREYKQYAQAVEGMLERTSTTPAPWTIVEATDRRWAEVETFTTLIAAMEARLEKLGKLPAPGAVGPVRTAAAGSPKARMPRAKRARRRSAPAPVAAAAGNGPGA